MPEKTTIDERLYLHNFAAMPVAPGCDSATFAEQLRALWTAYCFHENLDVDTDIYDRELASLWMDLDKSCAESDEEHLLSFDAFDAFMAALLV